MSVLWREVSNMESLSGSNNRISDTNYDESYSSSNSRSMEKMPSVELTDYTSDIEDEELWEAPSLILQERLEEVTTTKTYSDSGDEEDISTEPNIKTNLLRVPFPEYGVDIIDMNLLNLEAEISTNNDVKFTNTLSWEENWLFQKKKKADQIGYQFGYNDLDLARNPVRMLIPNPNEDILITLESRSIDSISELSERNSFGSLDFSDEDSGSLLQSSSCTSLSFSSDSKVEQQKLESQRTSYPENKHSIENHLNDIRTCLELETPKFVPQNHRKMDYINDPTFSLKPLDANVQKDILIQFCCRVKGSKPIFVSWFKDGEIINCNENLRFYFEYDEHILEIKRVSDASKGTYSCVAYNRIGQNWSDFKLHVREHENKNNSILNTQNKLKSQNSSKVVGVTTKVVQRTWAQRTAENELLELKFDKPQPGSIAEREHLKWNNPILVKDNPYSPENLIKRIERRAVSLNELNTVIDDDENEDDEHEEDTFLKTNHKNLNRFKRDYYVPLTKDETLNGFEEKVYTSSKYFDKKCENETDLINNLKNLEIVPKIEVVAKNEDVHQDTPKSMPSVKKLIERFTNKNTENRGSSLRRSSTFSSEINLSQRNGLGVRPRNYSSTFEVHSLTARSLARGFREKTQKNKPQVLNRHAAQVNPLVGKKSNESSSSSPTTSDPTDETNEGYASDESECKSNSLKLEIKTRPQGRKINRAVLKRASYWEKRCENGLYSDSSVNDEFPACEIFPD